jgi:mono/diheme cytochrome c family protein
MIGTGIDGDLILSSGPMKNRVILSAAVWLACCVSACSVLAQSLDKVPPPPPPVVPIFPAPAPPPPTAPNPAVAATPTAAVNSSPMVAKMEDLPASILAWDSLDKSVVVEFGTIDTNFIFCLTNVSSEALVVLGVRTSCGCTTAQLPPLPWKIEPGSNGVINVDMNIAGKSGTVIKSVSVETDQGTKHLIVRATILPLPSATAMEAGARERNQMLAQVDRQMVFKGDCASCHVEPGKGKKGPELYTAVCGVCHEAEHRSTMVPDLKVAKQERNAEYWRNWINKGKQGSLMPAFALDQGGIFSNEQIELLVEHLMKTMPAQPENTTRVVAPPR